MDIIYSIKRYILETIVSNRRAARKFILTAPLVVLLIGIILTGFGCLRYWYLVDNRQDQNMASYWGDGASIGYRHVSVFARGARPNGDTSVPLYIDATSSLRRSDIISIRGKLQSAADAGAAGSGKGGAAQDGSPQGWEDCYSSFLNGTVGLIPVNGSVNSSTNDSVLAQIVGVEGNYTAFHPFAFEAGGFLPQTVTDNKVIVLNDNLAWRFFMSYDVIGRKVSLWGQEFTIIGVVSEPDDKLADQTGANDFRVYVHFAALESFAIDATTASGSSTTSGSSTASNSSTRTTGAAASTATAASTASNSSTGTSTSRDVAILCYEAMLPELVRGVAKTDIVNALPSYNSASPQMYVISNTGRFGIVNVYKYMLPLGETMAFLMQFELPFWEKTANLTSEHLFVDMLVVVLGIIFILIGSVMFALKARKMTRKRNIRSSYNPYNT